MTTNAYRQLERAALRAHRRGERWASFWPTVAAHVQRAVPYDVGAYHRLVRRLLALLVSGDDSGMMAVGDAEPWDADDTALPNGIVTSDVMTQARINWLGAGIVEAKR
jgi:hypothetical protein